MNLVNNQYKVEKFLKKENFEDYLIRDSLDKNNLKFMRIIEGEKNKELIDFYISDFIRIKNIRHKNILDIDAFGIVETINLKRNNLPLYYVISDKPPETTLNNIYSDLSFFERIEIIQQLISIIAYLHFRGFAYNHLDPSFIFYSREEGLKVNSLTSTIENYYVQTIDKFNEDFIAPSILIRKDTNNLKTDYYSLGMIMRYLLIEDYADEKSNLFLDDLNIKSEHRDLLKNIIDSLFEAYKNHEELSLTDIVDELNEVVGKKFNHEFKKDREHLHFKTKLIGREKELKYLDEIDERMKSNTLDFNGLIIKGTAGVGKTRLIREIAFRLMNKGRDVFKVSVDQTTSYDLDIIKIFLNIVTKDVGPSILERYRNPFEKFIPEKYDYTESYVNESSLQKIELYKLFNSICNYLKEISIRRPVYIVVDNIEKYNETFISLIDYLLQSLFSSKVFIIFASDKIEEEMSLVNQIKKWVDDELIEEITLENLNEKEIGDLVQNILGMSFVPVKFSSVLYEASKGNSRFLDLIIKEIYSNRELYISHKGRWYSEQDNYSDLSLPTDYNKTIIKQTKNISGDRLKVLKLVSIANESLSKSIIFNMLNFDIEHLDKIIYSLVNEQILVENSYENNFYYSFLSTELRSTVYYDIDEKEKKSLHKQLAEFLFNYKPSLIRDLVEEITYHLIRAGERKRAIDIAVEEASKFDNIYVDKAVSLWEMAYSMVKDINHEKKIEIIEKLTMINFHKFKVEELELYLDELLKEATRINNIKHIVKAKDYYAELYFRNNDMDKLKGILSEIDRISTENNYVEGKIICYSLRIRILIKDSGADRIKIKEMLENALELSKRNSITNYLGKIYFLHGLYFDINRNPLEAIDYYEKSIKYLEENGDIYETIKAINNIGYVLLEQIGDRERCFEYFNQGLKISSKYGFTHLESIFLHNIGEAYLNILQHEKAKEYTQKSISLAQANKDMSTIIVANCNMGRIYLMTNDYEKAYKTYVLIKNIFINDLITDTEIIIAYRNFLAEFYFNFGKFDLSIKYSNLAKEMSQDFSLNFYFKSIFRLIQIDYIRGSVNKDYIYKVLEEYNRDDISELYTWNLFILISIALNKYDIEFANELITHYHTLSKSGYPELIGDVAIILDAYMSNEDTKLTEIEEVLRQTENKKDYNIGLRYYIHLANLYKNKKKYKKAIRYNIKAFDEIYKVVDSVDDDDLNLSFVKNLNAQELKDNISEILDKYYGMNISSMKFEDINKDNFHDYFDLRPVIDSLTNNEINEIVEYQDDLGIENVDDLISRLDGDYLSNINLVLRYLGKETLAQRGFVVKYVDDSINLKPIVSLLEDDTKLPNEMILHQSLRQRGGFLYNFNSQGLSNNKYSTYIPSEARGVICIPITSKNNDGSKDFKSYSDGNQSNIYGYIYLETKHVLNRFDGERRELAYALSKLISLNIENENLRLNSTTDKLTSVYSRKYFEDSFERILEEYSKKQEDLSVLMLDIDRFKGFNDKYGHLKGDEVLAQVANTIRTTVNTNGIVGRYGGEEFIVLLWDCDLNKGIEIGEQIRRNIENTHI